MFKNGIAGYNAAYALTHPWLIISYYYREIKYFIQRGYRGYSDRDNWSVDGFLLQILPPMLKNLRKNTYGHPIGLTAKKWDFILFQMEEGFKANRKLCNLEYNFKEKEVAKFLRWKSKKGLTLFCKHFNSLWD